MIDFRNAGNNRFLAVRELKIQGVRVPDYNRRAERERPAAKLKYDNKRFVLAFGGGSMDIDGSTIYYDSGAQAWRKFHNDDATASTLYVRLGEGLAECALRAQ